MFFQKRAMVLALLALSCESQFALADTSLNQKLIEQAQYWTQRGRDDNAADAWRKLLKIDPNSAEALAALGIFEAQNGNKEQAQTYLARLKQAHPNHPQIRLVEQALQQGTGGAKGQLENARRLAQQGDVEAAAENYKLLGDPSKLKGDAALEYFQVLAGTSAGYNDARRGLERLYKENPGNNRYALAYAQALTYREPTRYDGLVMLENLSGKPEVAKAANESWRQALTWMGIRSGNARYIKAYLEKHPDDQVIRKQLDNLNRVVTTQAAASVRRPPNKAQLFEELIAKSEIAGFKALEQGDSKAAEAEFQKILKKQPKNPAATGGLGLIKIKEESFVEARDLLAKAIGLAPKKQKAQWQKAYDGIAYWAYVEEARSAFEDSDSAKGIALLRKAIELNEKEPTAILQLGDALLAENDLPGAEANYRRVFNEDKKNDTALRGLISVLTLQKRIADLDAISAYMTAAQLASLAEMKAIELMDKSKEAEAAGDLAAAQLALEDATVIAPENVWVRLALAQLYLKHGMAGQASSVLDPMINVETPQPDALYVSALLSATQQLWWEGLVTLERVPESARRPEMFALQKRMWIYVQLDRVNLLLKRSEFKPALEILAAAEAAAGTDPEFVGAIVSLYIKNGDPERGLALIRQAMQKTAPPSASLMLQYADALLRTNQEAELEPLMRKIAALPKLSDAEIKSYNVLQRLLSMRYAERAREAGDLAKAYQYIQPLLIADPEDSLLLLALARMYATAEELEPAAELYAKVLQTDPDNTEVLQGLAYAAIQMKEYANAETHVNSLLALQPDNPRFVALAGRLARAQGNNSKALTYFKQALALEQSQHTMTGLGANGLRLVNPEPVSSVKNFAQNPFADRKSAAVTTPKVPGPLLKEVPAGGRFTTTIPAIPPRTVSSGGAAPVPVKAEPPVVMLAQAAPDERASKAAERDLPAIMPGLLPVLPQTAPVKEVAPIRATSPAVSQTYSPVPSSAPAYPAKSVASSRQVTLAAAETSETPVRKTAKAASAPVSAEEATLIKEIDAIKALNRSELTMEFSARARSGEKGLSQLKDLELPIELHVSTLGAGQLGLKIIPVSIDAGVLSLNDSNVAGQFGRNAEINERAKYAKIPFTEAARRAGLSTVAELNEEARGMALNLSYELGSFKLDVGSSPSNFPIRNVVGGVHWSGKVDEVTLGVEVSRRSVTDSFLSYAGTRDSLYGLQWGGVTRTGLRFDASYDTDDGGIFASGGSAVLKGRNVADNSMFDIGGGAYWRVIQRSDMVTTAGLSFTSMFYQKNLRYFTYGHGGYFSPKNYIALGVPVEVTGRKGNLAYQVGASVGVQRFTENSSPYYPISPLDQADLEAFAAANPTVNINSFYPGQTRSGIQYKLLGGLEYQLAPQFFIGGRLSLDNSGDFTDGSGAIYLKYTFEPQRKPISFPPLAPKPYYLGN